MTVTVRNKSALVVPPSVRRRAGLKHGDRVEFHVSGSVIEHNLHHPSLHAKKYDEARDIWQARVTRDWRLYFNIIDDTCIIRDIVSRPK